MARAVTKKLPPFTPVFDELAHRADMSTLAKNLYCFMARRNQGTPWRVSTWWLAGFWGVSHRQVACAIQNLERVGLLVVHHAGARKVSSYQVLPYQDSLVPGAPDLENQSGPWRTSLVPGAPDLVPEVTYREKETSESKKKDPPNLPAGGMERENSLSQSLEEKKKSHKVVASPELREAVVALFYGSGVPDSQLRHFNRYCNELATLSATPVQVRRRYRRWREKFPNATCTLYSLVKHWGVLYRAPYEGETETEDKRETNNERL